MKAWIQTPVKPVAMAAALALVACGGNGSSNSNLLSLSNKDDVLREIGMLDSGVDFVAMAATVPAVGTATLGAFADARRPMSFHASVVASQPLAETSNCGAGGTRTTDGGAKTRSFAFFGGTPVQVNYGNSTAAACKNALTTAAPGTATSTEDGFQESGAGTDSTGAAYTYFVAGTTAATYHLVTTTVQNGSTTYSEDYTAQGSYELQDRPDDDQVQTITVMAVTDNLAGSSQNNTDTSFSIGASANAFKMLQAKADGALGITGPFSYQISACGKGNGGGLFSTPESLTATSDSVGYYLTGGKLHLKRSDGPELTVTFNGDGSASFQFVDGTTGTLTRAEIQQQIDKHPCG